MNVELQRLLARYQSRGIVKAGELLLKPDDALELVNELRSLNIGVLGVDTWYFTAGKLAESLEGTDTSALLTAPGGSVRSIEAAEAFISNHLPPHVTYVSFVFQ